MKSKAIVRIAALVLASGIAVALFSAGSADASYIFERPSNRSILSIFTNVKSESASTESELTTSVEESIAAVSEVSEAPAVSETSEAAEESVPAVEPVVPAITEKATPVAVPVRGFSLLGRSNLTQILKQRSEQLAAEKAATEKLAAEKAAAEKAAAEKAAAEKAAAEKAAAEKAAAEKAAAEKAAAEKAAAEKVAAEKAAAEKAAAEKVEAPVVPVAETVTIKKTVVNETVYATTAVWMRSAHSTDGGRIKVLDEDASITRTAIYEDGWSGVLYNGTEVFIKTQYLTTDKPNNVSIVMGSTHWSYEREGLRISIDKINDNGIVYFVADIYTDSPDEDINTLLSGPDNNYNSCMAIKETASTLAEKANAILAINGDAVGFRSSKSAYQNPIVIRNGELLFEKEGNIGRMTCITADGDMFFVEGDDYTGEELLEMGVTDMWWFDGALIIDGVNRYEGQSFTWKNPQSAIGQKDANNWIFIVADGRGANGSTGVDYAQLANLMEKHGAVNAGILDGGGSSTMVFNGEVINEPSGGAERRISDIIYIAE